MKKLILLLYVAIVIVLAATTFVEYAMGTAWVGEHVYYTPAFCLLWGTLAVLTLYVLFKRKMWRHVASFGLHLSFIVMLAGALITFITSKKGYIHLRMDSPTAQFVDQDTRLVRDLPFTLVLDTFYVEHYPGTEAPADYVSVVRVSGEEALHEISMNNVFDHQGYRLYQSSFDEDERGSWLSVNYDPWGTAVTYIGYLLMAVSMVLVPLSRRGKFRQLLRHPLLRRGGTLAVAIVTALTSVGQTSTSRLPIISLEEADSLARTQVIYHDRVVPYNTLARDFVKKLSGETSIDGLTPEQIVGSWMRYPEAWQYVPIIKIKSDELRHRLGLGTEKHVRLIDLVNNGHYRLRELWHPDKQPSGKRTNLEKAILETDEKVALVWMLQQGTLIRPLPTDGSVEPLSEAKMKAELLYNRIPFSKILFMANLTLGFLTFGLLLMRSLGRQRRTRESRAWRWVSRAESGALLAALLFHLTGYLLRWYIGGRIPLSNGYETMQFMALSVLVIAFVLRRRFSFVIPFGFLLSGFTLLVSYLGQMNPQITPLMPVLASPWLSTHVSFIMISYSLLAFMCFNGVLGLCLPRESERLMLFSRLLLYPATFFLGIGIFIGAVWANVSWGRYWAWDPKEVWALITFMVYGLAFHADSLGWLRRPRGYHLYMVLAFLTVLMTYFGVNYLLGGMHSYA